MRAATRRASSAATGYRTRFSAAPGWAQSQQLGSRVVCSLSPGWLAPPSSRRSHPAPNRRRPSAQLAVRGCLRGLGEKRLALADVSSRVDLSVEREGTVELSVRLRSPSFIDELLRRPQPSVGLASDVADPSEHVRRAPKLARADCRRRL